MSRRVSLLTVLVVEVRVLVVEQVRVLVVEQVREVVEMATEALLKLVQQKAGA